MPHAYDTARDAGEDRRYGRVAGNKRQGNQVPAGVQGDAVHRQHWRHVEGATDGGGQPTAGRRQGVA